MEKYLFQYSIFSIIPFTKLFAYTSNIVSFCHWPLLFCSKVYWCKVVTRNLLHKKLVICKWASTIMTCYITNIFKPSKFWLWQTTKNVIFFTLKKFQKYRCKIEICQSKIYNCCILRYFYVRKCVQFEGKDRIYPLAVVVGQHKMN